MHNIGQVQGNLGKRENILTVATIISFSTIIGDKPHGVISRYESRIRCGKF